MNGKNQYTDFIGQLGLAFSGLYRTRLNNKRGELTYSCSVITLPAHPKLMPYHSKASPLMLPADSFGYWMSDDHDVAQFEDVLLPRITVTLTVVSIYKPSSFNTVGQQKTIDKD